MAVPIRKPLIYIDVQALMSEVMTFECLKLRQNVRISDYGFRLASFS
jgi:hypothetical protein